MVLIAIDKHSRKILGYLCRNSQNITYCCSECDVEFTRAKELEAHMVLHEMKSRPPPAETIDGYDIEEAKVSNFEKERQLQIKYQVTPCTVQLHRFEEFESNFSTVSDEENLNQENCVSPKGNQQKRRPGPASSTQPSSNAKKQKFNGQNSEKVPKKKPPSKNHPCFLCGNIFTSSLFLEQHQKTHLESTTSTPVFVFPCNICGKSVKNMKMHLRQHKNEHKTNNVQKAIKGEMSILSYKVASCKVEEASSSTDAVLNLNFKEPENGVTSNEDENPNSLSNESQDVLLTHEDTYPTRVDDSLQNNGELLEITENIPTQSVGEGENQLNGQSEMTERKQDVASEEIIEPTVGEETFNCAICAKILTSEVRLVKHLALHENKVRCEICTKLVGSSYKKIHMKKYHTEIQ